VDTPPLEAVALYFPPDCSRANPVVQGYTFELHSEEEERDRVCGLFFAEFFRVGHSLCSERSNNKVIVAVSAKKDAEPQEVVKGPLDSSFLF
jgi:hypothetical protein